MNNKRGFRNRGSANRRGQVWIETVVYTLIAFVLIGAVLAFARPKIEEMKDKAIIDKSISMLKMLDDTILSLGIAGNQRVIELGVDKGTLKIDGEQDKLIFDMDSVYTYGEVGRNISQEGLIILTEKKGDEKHITITSDYSGKYNITFDYSDKIKTITSSPNPYNLVIFKGREGANNLSVVDFSLK